MKSLIQHQHLWGTFDELPPGDCVHVTEKLFLHELISETKPPLYLALNALSGAVDFLTTEEGRLLWEMQRTGRRPQAATASIMRALRASGHLFRNREGERAAYFEIADRWTKQRLADSELLAFFAIDSLCAMGCDYCFQRQAERGKVRLERSRMTPDAA